MTSELITTRQTVDLVPAGASKNQRSQIGAFSAWLDSNGYQWHNPHLAEYRDHLLGNVSPKSTRGYLSTIRARLRELATNNGTRDQLYALAAQQSDDPLVRQAFVNEVLARLGNDLEPKATAVKVEKKQDITDQEHGLRLTKEQASALLASPGLVPIDRLRDTAILAVFLCTGIREQELVNLDVSDLRQTANGELCLHVRQGKGNKTRVVFWGGNQWALAIVDKWLERSAITEGAVFRGIRRGGAVRADRLSTRGVQKIVAKYPVMIEGKKASIHPHDLRRTYARLWYDLGGDLVGLQQNLGHTDLKTTLRYVGLLDASKRKPPTMYSYDLGQLEKVRG